MSLLTSIQLADNTLRATQVGLQVVGQNIANANTPGYIRENVNFTPAAGQRVGGLVEGLGVQVSGITQQVDAFLTQRLRNATSDSTGASVQQQTYQQLEGLMNELGDNGLSHSLGDFFSSVNEVLNQPSSTSIRNLAVLKGQALTGTLNQLAQQVQQARTDLNQQVVSSADDINRLVDQVRDLNLRIANTSSGNPQTNVAVGLTDQRNLALQQLSQLVKINVQDQPSGEAAVFAGGDYLVFNGESHHVAAVTAPNNGTTVDTIVITQSNSPLELGTGKLAGLVASRDKILGGFGDQLNSFAGTLAYEFNKVYASGQGLNGYQTVTSEHGVDGATQPLDAAGLPFTPANGSFQIQVFNRKTGLTQTSNIRVELNGLDHDTNLNDVAAQLNQVSGVSASINSVGQLTINSTSPGQEIAFANDTSGFLAAIGINTFFSGTNAMDLGINQAVVNDPGKFAASQGGVGQDTNNAVQLAGFFNAPLTSHNGNSIATLHNDLMNETAQNSAVAKSQADSSATFEAALQSQNTAVSGVSIDEETVNLLTYQRMYQASAKYISTINELLTTLVNL